MTTFFSLLWTDMKDQLKKPLALLAALVLTFFTLLTSSKYHHILYPVYINQYEYPLDTNTNVDLIPKIYNSISVSQFETDLNRLIKELPSSRKYNSKNGKVTTQYFHGELLKFQNEFISISEFKHQWEMSSLILNVNGPNARDDIIVIGCHMDSINMEISHHDSPGVDDNLSGVVILLNIIKTIHEHDDLINLLKHQLEFHFYSAEEYASLGSVDVFKKYKQDNKSIIAMLQLDMTGYTQGSTDAGIDPHFGLVMDYGSKPLIDFTKSLIAKYCSIPARETECGKICSDNAAALMFGYPSVYPLESEVELANPFRHSVKDTIELIDFNHIWEHWILAIAFTIELGTSNEVKKASTMEKFKFNRLDFPILELMHEPKIFVYLSFTFAGIVGTLYYIYLELTEKKQIDQPTDSEEVPLQVQPRRKLK